MQLRKLPRRFYERPTLTVARDLLGKYLCRTTGPSVLVGRIVEVEAYLAKGDPASHSFRRRTPRNEVMFRRGGCLYVYFTYGMHYCANVVTGRAGEGTAVLLRAVEPVGGLDIMMKNRTARHPVGWRVPPDHRLCSGPARLCEAFAIRRGANGMDLSGKEIWLAEDRTNSAPPPAVMSSRIGVTQGGDVPWRFSIQGSRSVSSPPPLE